MDENNFFIDDLKIPSEKNFILVLQALLASMKTHRIQMVKLNAEASTSKKTRVIYVYNIASSEEPMTLAYKVDAPNGMAGLRFSEQIPDELHARILEWLNSMNTIDLEHGGYLPGIYFKSTGKTLRFGLLFRNPKVSHVFNHEIGCVVSGTTAGNIPKTPRLINQLFRKTFGVDFAGVQVILMNLIAPLQQ